MQKWLYKNWWVLSINGLIAMLFGIVAFRVPIETFKSFVFSFGILILVSGIILIIIGFHNMKKKKHWVFLLLEGIFNLAVGVVIIFNSKITIDLFMVFFGIWALVLGIGQGIIGIKLKNTKPGNMLLYFNALLCLALGIILFYNPFISDSIFKKITGIIALLAGIIIIYYSFRLQASSKKLLSDQDNDQQQEEKTQEEEVKE